MPNCATCPRVLGPRNVSGLCRSCLARRHNACPVIQARRLAAINKRFADPVNRRAQAVRMVAAFRAWAATPEGKAFLSSNGKRLAREVLARPDVRAKSASPEVRERAGRKRTATMLAHIPMGWRDEYRRLCSAGYRAAEAATMIRAEVEIATKRYVAATRRAA